MTTAARLTSPPVQDLPPGRRRAASSTAVVLLMTSGTVPCDRLDAGGTRLRLRALHVMGHGSARIARALGVRERAIQRLACGDATTISPQLRDAIADLYDAWWDKRAPERTRAERFAASIARRRASAGNWCAAAALDDDQLDTPGYRPRTRYRPAKGTGTVPDFYSPAWNHRKSAT